MKDDDNEQDGSIENGEIVSTTNSDKYYSIEKEELKDTDKQYLYTSSKTLEHISFSNIKEIINEYLCYRGTMIVFNKLTCLEIKECLFEYPKMKPIQFPNIQTIIFDNSFPLFINEKSIDIFPVLSDISFMPKLQILKIENCFIGNYDFIQIMKNLFKEIKKIQSLTELSFAFNSLSSINFMEIILDNNTTNDNDNPQQPFGKVQMLNFSNNKISKFKTNYQKHFPSLKMLNLIMNNISRLSEIDLPNYQDSKITSQPLVLLNTNNAILCESNRSFCLERFKQILPNYDYSPKFFSFEGLFNKKTYEDITNYNLNEITCENIISLNLSYCFLSTKVTIDFLKTHKHMNQLSHLNLKANQIDISFFEQFNKIIDNNKNPTETFTMLQNLDMSNNLIDNVDFKEVYKFIISHEKLKYFNLQSNPFGSYYDAKKEPKPLNKQPYKIINPNQFVIFQNEQVRPKLDSLMNNKMAFDDLIKALYFPDIPFRLFYMNFSITSKIIKPEKYEKKQEVFMIKYKQSKKESIIVNNNK